MPATFEKLVEADIREAWIHEAHDFTPWLFANLESLGEALGLKLEPEGSEVAVDRFSADILARSSMDGSKVLIENQLAGSDHTHLGQIMTYLAGLEAKIVIWVATSFTSAHLSALKWLNDHTDEDYSFFAVRVKVVRIGNSPFAPVFEVLERPNEWEKQLHVVSTQGGRSELAERRHEFWQAFVDNVPGELERGGPAAYLSNRWRVLDEPAAIISMYTSNDSVGIFIRAAHYGSHDDMREILASKADAISEQIGVPMTNSDKYFFGDLKKGDYNNLAQRDELIGWLAGKADHYEQVLKMVFTR